MELKEDLNVLDVDFSWIGKSGVEVEVVDEEGKLLDAKRYDVDVSIRGKYGIFKIHCGEV